jgi:hypothetical protein
MNSVLKLFVFAEFEVVTPVVMKNSVFWDVTPCSPLKAKNISPPSSGLKMKRNKESAWSS